MPKLALDHHEGDAFMRHLDCVCVPQLVWREPTPDARLDSRVMKLFARC